MKKHTSRIFSLILMLAMLILGTASTFGVVVFASGSDVTVLSQDYENISENSVLTQSYRGWNDILMQGMPKIVSGGSEYDNGNVAEFDFSTNNWSTSNTNFIYYPVGLLYNGNPNEQMQGIPSPDDNYTLTLDFCNVSGYAGEYLYINLYDGVMGETNSQKKGYKISTGDFETGIWYKIIIQNTATTNSISARVLTGDDAGETVQLPNAIQSGLVSTKHANQFCITFCSQDTANQTHADRKVARFRIDNISLVETVTEQKPAITNTLMQLGADESKLNFTWFSTSIEQGSITYAKESDMTGGELPTGATTVLATRTDSRKEDYFGNKATISGLEPNTRYGYKIKNGTDETEIKYFTTGNAENSFSFAFVADAQIGASDNLAADTASWGRTLAQLMSASEFSGISFLMSAGDQSDSKGAGFAKRESQWDGFANHDELSEIPVVTVIGNHDDVQYSVYEQHTNQPNMLTKDDGSYYGATNDASVRNGYLHSADYYFTYKSALFIVLNTNTFTAADDTAASTEKDMASAEEHGEFIEKVLELTAGEDIKWTIVLCHQSPYGTSYHGNYETDGEGVYERTEQYAYINMRKYLFPILYENGVDVVLSGHDHCYTRTHILKPDTNEEDEYIDGAIITPYIDGSYEYADGTTEPSFVSWTDAVGNTYTNMKVSSKPTKVTNPDGILYLTAGTSSGSKVHSVDYDNQYTAATMQPNTRHMTRIDITDGELKILTYNLGTNDADNITLVDSFSIIHSDDTADGGDNGNSDIQQTLDSISDEIERLEAEIAEADTRLSSATAALEAALASKASASELAAIRSELTSAIESKVSATALSSALTSLRTELTSALDSKTNTTELTAALAAIRAELNTALNGKISAEALSSALSAALEDKASTDALTEALAQIKAELDAALDDAASEDELSDELARILAEADARIAKAKIIPIVIASVAVAMNIALVVFIIIKKRKK